MNFTINPVISGFYASALKPAKPYSFRGNAINTCQDVFQKNPEQILCQDIFDGDILKKDVKQKLLGLTEEYKNLLAFPANPLDLYIVGSMASYKYRPTSDIDLKLVLDYSKVQETKNKAFLEDYLRKTSDIFNLTHYKEINGHPVEVGAHDITKQHTSGIYSIVQDKWLKQPNVFKPQTDLAQIMQLPLYNYFVTNLSQAIQEKNKIKIGKTLRELSMLRNEALKTKGEMSTENWLYKALKCNEKKLFQSALKIMQELDE